MTDRALECFWNASGAPAPLRLLVRERGHREPVEHRSPLPLAIIGRDPACDLVLNHPEVSRRHAYIQLLGGRAFCLDLGSRSAIGWGGGPRRSGWIEPGRPVEIGPYRIGVAGAAQSGNAEPPDDPMAPRPIEPGTAPRIVLESVESSPSGRPPRQIDRTLTLVGRAPECHLRLTDLSVSRYHCALILASDRLWMIDLLGRKRVVLNDSPIRWACLENGDRIKLGRYLFTVHVEAPPALRVLNFASDLDLPSIPSRRPALPSPSPSGLPMPLVEALEPLLVELPQTDSTRAVEAIIGPLFNQFILMQQQLFEHHHRSMTELMHVFSRLRQDQQDSVNRELRRIRRLTKEVRSLKRELDQQRQHTTPPGNPSPASAGSDAPPLPSTPRGRPEDYRAAQARLLERMTALQQERQSRWQRLINRLSSSVSDDIDNHNDTDG